MKPKSEVAIRPGASSGNATRRNAPSRAQPSTCAASSSSGGMVAMKPRSTMTVKGRVTMKYTSVRVTSRSSMSVSRAMM
ncbi:hypothetical protein SGLAM104S_03231 [Streptomyces glaucescens]